MTGHKYSIGQQVWHAKTVCHMPKENVKWTYWHVMKFQPEGLETPGEIGENNISRQGDDHNDDPLSLYCCCYRNYALGVGSKGTDLCTSLCQLLP